MKIQIVDSETGDVVFVPSANQHLETEIAALFKERVAWWRPLKHLRHRALVREINAVAGELRELTRRV